MGKRTNSEKEENKGPKKIYIASGSSNQGEEDKKTFTCKQVIIDTQEEGKP